MAEGSATLETAARAIAAARSQNVHAAALLAGAEQRIGDAHAAGFAPDTPEGMRVLESVTTTLADYSRARTLAKVGCVLAFTAQAWLLIPEARGSVVECVYTHAQEMYDGRFLVRDCAADTPERIASIACDALERFGAGEKAYEVDETTAWRIAHAALASCEDATWFTHSPPHGWGTTLEVAEDGKARFIFDPEKERE